MEYSQTFPTKVERQQSMSELPEGWADCKLQDCVAVLDSLRVPINSDERKERQGNVPYYGATGQVGWIDDYLFDEELLLIGEDGAPFFDKTKPIAYIIRGKSWVNNHAHVLRALSDLTSNLYLKYFLDQFDFHEYVNGTTRLKLTQGSMNEIPVKLPPLNEQRRIVAKVEKLLSRVDAAQARLDEIPRILKRFRQSVLAAACSGQLTADWREQNLNIEPASRRWGLTLSPIHNEDYPDLPDTWIYRTLDNISLRVSVGHVGPTSQFYCEPDEGITFLRSQNVRPMQLNLDGVAYITKNFNRSLKKSQLKPGDLLIVRVGANRGDTCIVPSGIGEMNCANVIFARPLDNISDYLNIYFQTPFCQKTLEDLTTGSAQGVINTKVVAEVPVPIPPLEEQQEITLRVEALFKTADALETRYRTAKAHVDKLTQSILARAFRGELVTTEAELARREGRAYEPASVLLERIRQERAQQQQQAAPKQKSKQPRPTRKRAAASPKLFS